MFLCEQQCYANMFRAFVKMGGIFFVLDTISEWFFQTVLRLNVFFFVFSRGIGEKTMWLFRFLYRSPFLYRDGGDNYSCLILKRHALNFR